jgi:hypothetical protein
MYHVIITEKSLFLSHDVFMRFALFSEYGINTSLTTVNREVFAIEMQWEKLQFQASEANMAK